MSKSKLKEYIIWQFSITDPRRVRMSDRIIDEGWAFDLSTCPVSVSYLRQELRRAGFRTILHGKKWMLVFKKEL